MVNIEDLTYGRLKNWPIDKALTVAPGTRVLPAHNKLHLTKDGITDSLTGWANRLGISTATTHKRVKNGKF